MMDSAMKALVDDNGHLEKGVTEDNFVDSYEIKFTYPTRCAV